MQQRASDLDNLFGTKMGNRLRSFEAKVLTRIFGSNGGRSGRMKNNRREGFAFPLSTMYWRNQTGVDEMGFEMYHVWEY